MQVPRGGGGGDLPLPQAGGWCRDSAEAAQCREEAPPPTPQLQHLPMSPLDLRADRAVCKDGAGAAAVAQPVTFAAAAPTSPAPLESWLPNRTSLSRGCPSQSPPTDAAAADVRVSGGLSPAPRSPSTTPMQYRARLRGPPPDCRRLRDQLLAALASADLLPRADQVVVEERAAAAGDGDGPAAAHDNGRSPWRRYPAESSEGGRRRLSSAAGTSVVADRRQRAVLLTFRNSTDLGPLLVSGNALARAFYTLPVLTSMVGGSRGSAGLRQAFRPVAAATFAPLRCEVRRGSLATASSPTDAR